MITDKERDGLINAIQAHTRGTTVEERLVMAECWEFMALELRRVCAFSDGCTPAMDQHQPQQSLD